ncbi:MAG: FAD:protein FMN transferase [Dehalococcoidia bacterium]|nr:MAG: FAD:protein FMN transferase [Dehalococcoidia bacterium]
MEREFRAMGTEWWLRADRASMALMDRAQGLVEMIESRLSRFRPASALSRLNRDRCVEDEMLSAVLLAAEDVRVRTSGAFDARVGSAVVAAGYDRSFEDLGATDAAPSDPRRPEVVVAGASVRLVGEGALDLGGIAKGWTVDRVADLLSASGPCLVDGGGDIAVRGRPRDASEWAIGIGDEQTVGLEHGAVATSSTLHRCWRAGNGVAHHIIDPETGRPAAGLTNTVVIARAAYLADALATALIADMQRALPALREAGAEALVQHSDGRWEMTAGMGRFLR